MLPSLLWHADVRGRSIVNAMDVRTMRTRTGPARSGTSLRAFCLLITVSVSSGAYTAVAAQVPNEVVVVHIETAKGLIAAEIYVTAAPIKAQNFLAYADEGIFDGGSFFRSVRMDNQPNDSVRIEVIQGGPDRSVGDRLRPSIPLERTSVTGLRHLDGTLSMARAAAPDSGGSQFFICVGDQPALDFGGALNVDGQGFAAFGRVIAGMDVVRAIQMDDVEAQQLKDRVRIVRARRTNED